MNAWIIEAFGRDGASRYDVSWAIRLMAIAIAALLVFCITIFYQTIATHEPPIVFDEGQVRAWSDLARDSVTINYAHTIVAKEDVSGVVVQRSIECLVNGYRQVYDLQPLSLSYSAGSSQNVDRLVVYPYPLAVGTKCSMGTVVRWTPKLSINEHSFELPKIGFAVDQLPSNIREPR